MYKPTKSDDIYQERYMSQSGLLSFVDNLKDNSFSEMVFEQTEKIQKKLNKTIKSYIKNQDESNINDDYYLHLDTEFLEDKISALSEMNIIYAYKDFEINLKKLVGAAYGVKTKEFYKWEAIKQFLLSKGIKVHELKGFQEINDLRKINNYIKHSTSKIIDKEIKGISEFTKLENIQSENLTLFFKRIKNSPYTFLYSLSSEINKNLYEFDSARLKSIAKKFALRMDKKSAMELIEQLKKLY